MVGFIFEEDSSFKMLKLSFSSKLDLGSRIISIEKIVSKKIGALICCIKFLSPEVSLHQYKYPIQPCLEDSRHVCSGAPSC